MLSIPSACLTAEDFVAHGCDFFVIGTNDLTQYTHAADRELASAEHYYRPASPAMKKLITMVMDAAGCAPRPGDYLRPCRGQPRQHGAVPAPWSAQLLGKPQNLLKVKARPAGHRCPPGCRGKRLKTFTKRNII